MNPQHRNAVLVATFDSQLKWCARIRDELAARGVDCRVVVPDTRSALSDRQVRDAGFDRVDHLRWDALVAAAFDADVVVCGVTGPLVVRLSVDLARTSRTTGRPAPVTVSGWVGVIIEQITAGYLSRAGTDVVAVNSTGDLAHFRRTAERLGLPDGNLLLTGLPFLSTSPAPQRTGPVRRVLFADQPTVPADPAERRHLYERLVEHARRHPDREVLLKPRHRIGEDTYHRMEHHPEDLVADLDLPANFRIDHTPIREALPGVDLLLTVSSTACLEAVDAGCRVALVADLGVHEKYGNHVFLDSGLLRTFDQVDADDVGSPDAAWLEDWFGGRDASTVEVLVDRVEKLLATGERPAADVWDTPYFRSVEALQGLRETGRLSHHLGRWARRRHAHGVVRGTGVHLALELLPPAVVRPVRRALRPE